MSSPRSSLADTTTTAWASWTPGTDAEREAVREHVGRILASALFRNSRRFPSFLRITVEHTLDGTTESLKERTLGVEAFGREPDYDTAQDPVVRMTAVEVRKRLVQYYQAPGREDKIRIGFEPGSYIPEFYRPLTTPAVASPISAESDSTPLPAAADAASNGNARVPSSPTRLRVVAWAATVIAASALVLVAWVTLPALSRTSASSTALDLFWSPVVDASAPALLCIGDQSRGNAVSSNDAGALTAGEFFQRSAVRYTDAVTLAHLTGELRARKKAFRIRRPDATDFADLRDGPVVLVGGFNNAWTMRMSDGLRFTLASDDRHSVIVDRQQPDRRQWIVDRTAPLGAIQETYGLITRVFDARTGQPIVMTAGLALGTRAAGECLTDPSCLETARRLAPGDWRRGNIQVVVATKVIGDEPGAPRVVAAHLW